MEWLGVWFEKQEEPCMSPKQQRLARLYQSKSRGDRRSYKTELENVQLLLAWEAGDLSEGQVSSILGVDRVSL